MVNKTEVLAIIPARGGSKGIPRKNIKGFAGYPLIAYSIVAALQSKLVTRVVVSTDDNEIAAVARQWGAEVPFMRPAEYAQDNTLDYPVIRHALDWLEENEEYHPEVVVQLRPTSPVRPKNCLDDAVNLLLEHPEADCVRGVVSAAQNPFKMWIIDIQSGQMKSLLTVEGLKEPYNAPRQVLPETFWQTGHIDAIRTKTILGKGSLTGDVIFPLLIDPRFTVDIDVPSDWKVSERLVQNGDLDMVDPANLRRSFPNKIQLLALDFDGVLTDNRVWTDQNGVESVASNRSDSHGLELLRTHTQFDVVVISKEINPVVTARCQKLRLPVIQSVQDKKEAIKKLIEEKGIDPESVIFMGNDVNDLPAFEIAGYSVAPADSHPEVKRRADLVLSMNGGQGAVRELCDIILAHLEIKY